MRIAHIYARAPNKYVWNERVDVRFWKMSEWLHRHGETIIDITKGEGKEKKLFQGIETHRIPAVNVFEFSLKAALLLSKINKEKKLDIVHGHRHSGVLPAIMARKLFGIEIPIIFDYHDPWSGESLISKLNLWQRFKIRIFRILEGFIVRNVDYIITVTEFQSDILGKRYDLPKNKLAVVYNMADISIFKPSLADKKGFGFSNKKVVFFLGSVVPYFGLHLLVEAAEIVLKRIPDALFVIKGVFHDKEYGKKIIKLIGSKGLGENFIIIKEWLDEEELASMAASADIAVIMHMKTPLTETASPDKLYEYFACGLPVVSTNLKNLREWVIPNKTGLLVSHKPKDIAAAIIRLLENDRLRRKISKNVRKMCEKGWNWDFEMGKVKRIYRMILENRD